MAQQNERDDDSGCFPLEAGDEVDEFKYIYRMNRKHRGMAVIINNKEFKVINKITGEERRLPERNGTDVDAANMYTVLSQLGFNITMTKNLNRINMISLLKQAAKQDHSKADCFACVILSHGKADGIIWATDGLIKVESLVEPFKGNKCSTLVGKPKLFFIQACRGGNQDEGVIVDDSDATEHTKVSRIPSEADFMIAYSSVPGYLSWRDTMNGSWFIQAIYKVFKEHGTSKEIMWLMTRVNRMVAYDFGDTDSETLKKRKMIPSIVSMLTKELYFKPKQ